MLTEDRDQCKRNEKEVTYDTEVITEFSAEEIKDLLRGMKNGKASGSGWIPVVLYKNSPDIVIEILTKIYNKCIKGEKIPNEWKLAYTKKAPKQNVSTEG